jgi:hypothetical protein
MAARGVVAVGLLALTLLTPRAEAQPAQPGQPAQPTDDPSRAEARKIGYAGVEAYQSGDFATAHDRLETAYQMLRVPSLGLWSARALAKLGKLVEAEARYLAVIRLPTSVGDEAIQEQARQDARNERADLARRIPSVRVRIEGAPAAEVAVTIDGAPLSGSAVGENHLLNPGRHRVDGVRASARASAEVVVAEGDQKEAVLRFAGATADAAGTPAVDVPLAAPRPDSASATKRTVGWATVAAGGAGILVGAVTGLMAMSKKGALDDAGCMSGDCPTSQRDAVDSYERMRLVSGVGLIAGAVLAGAGTYLLVTTPSNDGVGGEHASVAAKTRAPITNIRFAIVPGGTLLRGEF